MRTSILPPAVLALLFATACRATRLALEPIENQRELPLTYRTGWELGALAPGDAQAEPVADSGAARVRVTFVHLSTAESEALFGPIGARPSALEVAPRDAERLLAAVQDQVSGRLVEAETVAVASGEPGEVRISKQCAYVAAFELTQTPGAVVADPIVQVIEDGCLLRLVSRAATDEEATELAVEVVLADLERPMRERRIELPGSGIQVAVQRPACLMQRIETDASLSPSRALMIAGIPAREAGQTLLVVLRLE